MVIDASAIIAMLAGEADADEFADTLAAASMRLAPAIAVWETVAGLANQYAISIPVARRKVAEFIRVAEIEIAPIGESELEFALDAYDKFGKGRHPARLNMGDCFVYAVAKAKDAPLLHKDQGFWLTDIEHARPRA
jgi:ribonuclease VapC